MLQNEIVRLIIIIFDIGTGVALLMSMVLFSQIREMNVFWRFALWIGASGLLASAQLQIGIIYNETTSITFLGIPMWAFKDVGYWFFVLGLYYFEFNRNSTKKRKQI